MSVFQPGDLRCLVPGRAGGRVACLAAPLSLWGGFDLERGVVCDVNHPDHGRRIAGRVLVMPGGRGSSSSASVLLEAARRGRHPAAIVIAERDPILTVGALVAADLYSIEIPLLQASLEALRAIGKLAAAKIEASPLKVSVEPL